MDGDRVASGSRRLEADGGVVLARDDVGVRGDQARRGDPARPRDAEPAGRPEHPDDAGVGRLHLRVPGDLRVGRADAGVGALDRDARVDPVERVQQVARRAGTPRSAPAGSSSAAPRASAPSRPARSGRPPRTARRWRGRARPAAALHRRRPGPAPPRCAGAAWCRSPWATPSRETATKPPISSGAGQRRRGRVGRLRAVGEQLGPEPGPEQGPGREAGEAEQADDQALPVAPAAAISRAKATIIQSRPVTGGIKAARLRHPGCGAGCTHRLHFLRDSRRRPRRREHARASATTGRRRARRTAAVAAPPGPPPSERRAACVRRALPLVLAPASLRRRRRDVRRLGRGGPGQPLHPGLGGPGLRGDARRALARRPGAVPPGPVHRRLQGGADRLDRHGDQPGRRQRARRRRDDVEVGRADRDLRPRRGRPADAVQQREDRLGAAPHLPGAAGGRARRAAADAGRARGDPGRRTARRSPRARAATAARRSGSAAIDVTGEVGTPDAELQAQGRGLRLSGRPGRPASAASSWPSTPSSPGKPGGELLAVARRHRPPGRRPEHARAACWRPPSRRPGAT